MIIPLDSLINYMQCQQCTTGRINARVQLSACLVGRKSGSYYILLSLLFQRHFHHAYIYSTLTYRYVLCGKKSAEYCGGKKFA